MKLSKTPTFVIGLLATTLLSSHARGQVSFPGRSCWGVRQTTP